MPCAKTPKSLATNLIACGASEVAAKASRLFVVVALDLTLDHTQIGIASSPIAAGLVQVALAMRSGKLSQTAAIGGARVVGANLLSIALVLVYPSALALILPRILSAPIWLFVVRALHPWSPKAGIKPAPLRPFITYGWAVLGVEVLRLQGDKIVVGLAFGPYFMAFSAELSLSNAFATVFSTVVFPHLSQSSDRAAAMRQSIIVGLGLIAAIVILQSALVS